MCHATSRDAPPLFCFVFLLSIPARAQSENTNIEPFSSSEAVNHPPALRKTRQSPSDLELGGELAGLPVERRGISHELNFSRCRK